MERSKYSAGNELLLLDKRLANDTAALAALLVSVV